MRPSRLIMFDFLKFVSAMSARVRALLAMIRWMLAALQTARMTHVSAETAERSNELRASAHQTDAHTADLRTIADKTETIRQFGDISFNQA